MQGSNLTPSTSTFATRAGFFCIVLFATQWTGKSSAEEPANEFVQRLAAAGYYDVALSYIDRIKDNPAVNENFRGSVDFQKAQVYVAAAQASRSPDKLDQQLRLAERSLQSFVAGGEHPRTREAQMQIASLQKIRADRLMAGEVTDEIRVDARDAYLSAGKTFTELTDAIREKLTEMRGAKIDPSKDREAAELRDQLRAEYLQGLVSGADAQKLAAETFPNADSTAAKKLFESSLEQFDELADKYAEYVPGATAKLYAGEIKEKLGQIQAARASYTEMLSSLDADGLRDAKFRAAAGLLRLAKDASPALIKDAMEAATPLIDDVRPDERSLPSANRMQLEFAKLLMSSSEDPASNQKNIQARKLLTRMVAFPGAHVDPAKALLKDLGVDLDQEARLPSRADTPMSTADAVAKAQRLLQVVTESNALLKSLESDPASDSGKDQRAAINAALIENRELAASLLSQGLAMVDKSTENQTIIDARQLLAYSLSIDGRYRDAFVVGRSLAKLSPGSPTGLSGGIIALGSIQNLIRDDPSNEDLINQLSSLANFLSVTWPDDPQAQSAKSAVVQLALQNKELQRATLLIAEMGNSQEKFSLQRLLGRMQYADAIAASREDDSLKSESLRNLAAENLTAGLESVTSSSVDESVAKAALVLAKIQTMRGDAAAAVATIDHPVYGPSTLAKKINADADFQTDLYSTELRAVVGTMTGSGDAQIDITETLTRAIATMEKLQAANRGEQSAARLQGIYLTMARDIRDEIEAAGPERKVQLTDAFHEFLKRMATTSDDPAMLQWIGQTLLSLGESAIAPGQRIATGQAASLMQTATKTFDRLTSGNDSITPVLRFQQAKTKRLLGQYKESIDTLETILKESPSMLDAQIEAALAYEQYAGKVPEKYTDKVYAAALYGARPGGDKNENVIWGWGKISLLTSKNPKFADKFFMARYHVALCRYLQGKAANDPALTRKAITDITQIESLYPEMGGPKLRNQFDQLLRRVQGEVGAEVTGLNPLDSK